MVLVGKKESEVEAGLGPRQYRQYRFHIKLLQNPRIAYEYIHRILVVLVGNEGSEVEAGLVQGRVILRDWRYQVVG